MDRREFLNDTSIAAIASLLLNGSNESNFLRASDLGTIAQGSAKNPMQSATSTSHLLTQTEDPAAVSEAYKLGTRALGAAAVPYVYAYYDETVNKFLNPLAETKELRPSLKKGTYVMTPTLQAFNIRKAEQANFRHLQNQLQLGFNATAPTAAQGDLSWIFLNAVDVFLAKDDKQRDSQLTKFSSTANQSGTKLNSDPQITVESGTVKLQVTAFGQKKASIWTQFFDIIAKVMKSPVVSTAAKGFGIPALATEAVTFVDGVLDSIQKQSSLVALWKTGSLEFAVTEDATARFNMKEGLWVTVDSEYAQKSKFLEGHTLDLKLQSFRIVDASTNPVDANYLVTDIRLPPKK
jgi:nucleoside phosphorylase